jgi:hypothetical protein
MIIDPFGDVIGECRALDDDISAAVCTRDKLTDGGGHRYRQARRPELYAEIIGRAHDADLRVAWRVM